MLANSGILWFAVSARAGSVTHTNSTDWQDSSISDNIHIDVAGELMTVDEVVDEVDGWYRGVWSLTDPLEAQASKADDTWFSSPDRCFPDLSNTSYRGPTRILGNEEVRSGPHVENFLGTNYMSAVPSGTRLELPTALSPRSIRVLIGGARIAQRDLTIRFYYTDGTNAQVVVPIPVDTVLSIARSGFGVNYVRTGLNGPNSVSNALWDKNVAGGSDCAGDGSDYIEATNPQPTKVLEAIGFQYTDYDHAAASSGWLGGPLAVSLVDVDYDAVYTYRGLWALPTDTAEVVDAGTNALYYKISTSQSGRVFLDVSCGDDLDQDGLLEANEVSLWASEIETSPYEPEQPCAGRYLTYEVELVDDLIDSPFLYDMSIYYDIDADGDGFGVEGLGTEEDCDDNNSDIFPTQIEIINNGVDEDCDYRELCYRDADRDGARTWDTVLSFDMDCIDLDEAEPTDPIDCDDTDASISPLANEVVGDDIDQDCDEHDACYLDIDRDGYGSAIVDAEGYLCEASNSEARLGGDCADNDAARFPDQIEIVADGVDQDCNGHDTCYADVDRDSYGDPLVYTESDEETCVGFGEATSGTDCDDWDNDIHPDATELPGDLRDEDCDEIEICYVDGDDDGARGTGTVQSEDLDCNNPGLALAADPLDCDDANSLIHPGAVEIPANGIDENCNGNELCYVDADDDGARTENVQFSFGDLDCLEPGEGQALDPLDCDDEDALTYPGAVEIPGDNVDEDCDETEICFTDADEDGAHGSGTLQTSPGDLDCSDPAEGEASDPVDCDDADAMIHPDATEICNGLDDDCDGDSDDVEGELASWYADSDGDTFGDPLTEVQEVCAPEGMVTDDSDCDDDDAEVHPDTAEVCNGLDDDCDEELDNVGEISTWYRDLDGDGVGTDDEALEAACPPDAGWADVAGDCDDDNSKLTDTCVAGSGCGCRQTPSPLAAWPLLALLMLRVRGSRGSRA